MWLFFAVSQLPVVVIFSYVYFRDRAEKEPLILLIKLFILGTLTCLPAGLIEGVLDFPTSPESGVGPIGLFFSIMFGVALVEEAIKFFALQRYAYNRPEFSEPYDGIMYGVAISLGFAAFENFFYVVAYGLGTAVLRMFTAVPMHAATGVLMGYHTGRAKYAADDAERVRHLRKGLLIAVLLHGVYDYFLFLGDPELVMLALVVLAYQVRLARRAIFEFAAEPPKAVLAAIKVPPPPPEERGAQPQRLKWAVRPLQLIGFTVLIAIPVLILQLVFHSDELTPDIRQSYSIALVGAFISFSFFAYLVRGLLRASRLAWVLSLTVFIFLLGTPLFLVGVAGLSGLLPEASRKYFWGEEKAREQTARAGA